MVRSTSAPRTGLWSSYHFGTSTAEFLICRRGGVYIAAIGQTASGIRAMININCLNDRTAFTQQPHPIDHEGE
jgi:hypothetical protein